MNEIAEKLGNEEACLLRVLTVLVMHLVHETAADQKTLVAVTYKIQLPCDLRVRTCDGGVARRKKVGEENGLLGDVHLAIEVVPIGALPVLAEQEDSGAMRTNICSAQPSGAHLCKETVRLDGGPKVVGRDTPSKEGGVDGVGKLETLVVDSVGVCISLNGTKEGLDLVKGDRVHKKPEKSIETKLGRAGLTVGRQREFLPKGAAL
mmetsp:Transcript_10867/g.33315  ORF Transcript_10867/g.33315 Transcript_10867/m.33315 type:complete len:206 (-) Transcript_10867:201-818(-)